MAKDKEEKTTYALINDLLNAIEKDCDLNTLLIPHPENITEEIYYPAWAKVIKELVRKGQESLAVDIVLHVIHHVIRLRMKEPDKKSNEIVRLMRQEINQYNEKVSELEKDKRILQRFVLELTEKNGVKEEEESDDDDETTEQTTHESFEDTGKNQQISEEGTNTVGDKTFIEDL